MYKSTNQHLPPLLFLASAVKIRFFSVFLLPTKERFVIVLFFFPPRLYDQAAGPAGDCSGGSVALLGKHLKRY